jgi:signal transduction histidine kinase
MRKKYLLLFLICILHLNINAQKNQLPTYRINTDTAISFSVQGEFLSYWADSAGSTTFDSIYKTGIVNRFKPFDSTQQTNYAIKTYWYKFKIKNNTTKDLSLGYKVWTLYADLYYADSTLKWKHLKNGRGYSKADRDGYSLLNLIDFNIPAQGEVMVFLRRNSYYRNEPPKAIDLYLMQNALEKEFTVKKKLFEIPPSEIILSAFLLGMILISCITNLTFYRAIKEKEYLYFVLFLLAMGLNNLFGYLSDLFFDKSTFFTTVASFLTTLLLFFYLMRFIQYFFRTKEYLPKWNKFLNWYNYVMVVVWSISYMLTFSQIDKKSFELILDITGFLIYFFMDTLFITIFLILFKKQVKINLRLLAIVPLLFVFGPLFSIGFFYQLAEKYFQVTQPAFVQSLNEWTTLLITIGIFWVILFFSWLLFKRYQSIQEKLIQETLDRQKLQQEKEAEKILLIAQQKEKLEIEVDERTKELKATIETLKATQSQLIQSEKMASLGELTAGIAHEIQNPLNFVNNFSEVSNELIGEMMDEVNKGDFEEAKAIANDIKQNLEKINHHGKRADAIVKGMLQHSRSSNNAKEPTNINALADEYLRLSYHGLRAKDKSFNATMKTDFDETIGKINIIPQDLGRVILNLITNAFYATSERKKMEGASYEPTVSVSTKKMADNILITVKDNGNGIPQKVLDKIFQPFFTTKPTGEGTGLGLSISYDIIKTHGGILTVNTVEREGTAFTITLPYTD